MFMRGYKNIYVLERRNDNSDIQKMINLFLKTNHRCNYSAYFNYFAAKTEFFYQNMLILYFIKITFILKWNFMYKYMSWLGAWG